METKIFLIVVYICSIILIIGNVFYYCFIKHSIKKKKNLYNYCKKFNLVDNEDLSINGIEYINKYIINIFTVIYYLIFAFSIILLIIQVIIK